MEGEVKNLIEVWSSVIASLCYCYFISSRIPKGKYRFLSLLPIFSLFTILPLHLTSAAPTAVTSFFITWLANFKLLLFSFDLGPLSPADPPKSLPLFITVACLPISTMQNHSRPSHQNPQSPSKNLGAEMVLFSLLIGVLHGYRDLLHRKILWTLYCCLVFLMIDVLVGLSNAVVRALVGLELDPPSDEPYFSTSLQDFWGRRWNLTVTNALRHTVYKPVRSASEALLGRRWAPALAVFATFLVSGLMHELLLYYITRASPTWEMSGFFLLHGACVVAELGVKRALSGRCRLHWAVSRPLTVGFVVATSFWLFLPPLTSNGSDARVIEEFKICGDFIKQNLILIAKTLS